jgi:hypothetical protein
MNLLSFAFSQLECSLLSLLQFRTGITSVSDCIGTASDFSFKPNSIMHYDFALNCFFPKIHLSGLCALCMELACTDFIPTKSVKLSTFLRSYGFLPGSIAHSAV